MTQSGGTHEDAGGGKERTREGENEGGRGREGGRRFRLIAQTLEMYMCASAQTLIKRTDLFVLAVCVVVWLEQMLQRLQRLQMQLLIVGAVWLVVAVVGACGHEHRRCACACI